MRIMKVNFLKCKECWACDITFPNFRKIYGGIIKIDEGDIDQELRAAAQRTKEACPNEAIVLTYYPD